MDKTAQMKKALQMVMDDLPNLYCDGICEGLLENVTLREETIYAIEQSLVEPWEGGTDVHKDIHDAVDTILHDSSRSKSSMSKSNSAIRGT